MTGGVCGISGSRTRFQPMLDLVPMMVARVLRQGTDEVGLHVKVELLSWLWGSALALGENRAPVLSMPVATVSIDVIFLVELWSWIFMHPRCLVLWYLSEKLRPASPVRMTVVCPRHHFLLGAVIVESIMMSFFYSVWLKVMCQVVVARPTWGRWWCVGLVDWCGGCFSWVRQWW